MSSSKSRRHDMDEDDGRDCFDVVTKMGMPLLYTIAILTGIVGAICQGVITNYWKNLSNGNCFLYAKTASNSVVYQFGSSISICEWITYGGVVAIIIAFITCLVYIIRTRQNKKLTYSSAVSIAGILMSFLLMLAVTCTMAEGLRISCAAMGINSANNKGDNCYSKLDQRIVGEQLPIATSTMVHAALISYCCSSVALFVICCFHLSDFYRRTQRYQRHRRESYDDVPYDDRR